MKRRLLVILLIVCMVMSLLPVSASAIEWTETSASGTWGDLTWSIDRQNKILTISGNGAIQDGTVSDSPTWNSCSTHFTSVIIEEGITSIGDWAFGSNVENITIPDSVTSIGDFAFASCYKLTDIALPASVTSIGQRAFSFCEALESITMPNVESIGDYAFQGCKSLNVITLPASLTTVGDGLFTECSLSSVILQEGMKEIPNQMFSSCSTLKEIQIPASVESIGTAAFYNTGLTSIVIPEGVKTLGDMAFNGCADLTSALIPGSVMSIGTSVFGNCEKLSSVTLSQGLALLGNAMFYNCPALSEIQLPNMLTSIGDYVFRASGITDLTIPQSVTYFGEWPLGLDDEFNFIDSLTIRGYAGTVAEDYITACNAYDVGYTFIDLTPKSNTGSGSSSRHNHKWDDGVITLEPTASSSGTRRYTCTACGATKIESIPALGTNLEMGETVMIGGNTAPTDEPTQPEGPGTGAFSDVSSSAYYADAVRWAVENGITSGTSATTFSPDAFCTRAQTVTFLWRAMGSPEPDSATSPFTDVSADDYYYKAVLWAMEKGITAGTSATTFSPDASCTRGQVVTFLWRTEGQPAASGNIFSDVNSTAYYGPAVAWAVQQQITSGTSETTFSPDATCTRGQIVTFLYRHLAK